MSELSSIKQELKSIIKELESIEAGIRQDFKGIGSEVCAHCINYVIVYRLYKARNKLSNVDTSRISSEFLAKQGKAA